MNRNTLLSQIIKDSEAIEVFSTYDLEVSIAFNVGQDFFTVAVDDIIEDICFTCQLNTTPMGGYFVITQQILHGETYTPKGVTTYLFHSYKQGREMFKKAVMNKFPQKLAGFSEIT